MGESIIWSMNFLPCFKSSKLCWYYWHLHVSACQFSFWNAVTFGEAKFQADVNKVGGGGGRVWPKCPVDIKWGRSEWPLTRYGRDTIAFYEPRLAELLFTHLWHQAWESLQTSLAPFYYYEPTTRIPFTCSRAETQDEKIVPSNEILLWVFWKNWNLAE